ncbi:biotin/lipoyl attachment [Lucifera butyrica]|uniref:Biotin/lipoyl attachment n=1 Tax=Lucifera butyrica TaxID=1351585 RepID=A0A498RC71_9FIRM|nr:biotin/lipoyl-containing protein [Lucifera butyrica]VBB07842.1 biotin/lipoyl attachment [Lucifera butyrica]
MTTYTITVNGKSYDVTVEKKGEAVTPRVAAPSASAPAPAPAAAPVAAPAPAPKASAPAAGGAGSQVAAPMPGKVIALKVKTGDSVKKGQEVLVMEAMKMHNPVLASGDGVVKEIYVKEGDPVQAGQALALIG